MPKPKDFTDMLRDKIIKSSGTFFLTQKKKGKIYYAKFDDAGNIYSARKDEDGHIVIDRSCGENCKFTKSSGWVVYIFNLGRDFSVDTKLTGSGPENIYYSDNEEYYDSIKLVDLRDAAYEEVITPSSL